MKKFLSIFSFVILACLVGIIASYAGSLTPPGSPSKTMKSLSDLYELINTGSNTPANNFTTPGSISPTMNTLGDTYDLLNTKIGLIDTSKANILAGTTFFGINGTMVNNGAITITPGAVDQAIPIGYHNGSGVVSGDADLVVGNIKSGVNIFGVTGTLSSGGLPNTNQTICYNVAGAVIACTDGGTALGGQDGYYQKGIALSYVDNGNGTISDTATGLMWKKAFTSVNWTNALSTCEADTTAGFTDWRLPNIKELFSLVDFGRTGLSINPVFNSLAGQYWSSTSFQGAETYAWYVLFSSGGYINGLDKTSSAYARCVR